MNGTESKPNILEKVLVNWATPYEIIAIGGLKIVFGTEVMNQGFRGYIDKHGVVKGLWKSKIDSYKRLMENGSNSGKIPKKILGLYDQTPCGSVMIGVHYLFRE